MSGTPQQQEQRFGKRGSGQAFALGLFQILKTEDPSIIGWSASGKAFRITDSERFCRDIMPRFFKRELFIRLLLLYSTLDCWLCKSDCVGGAEHEGSSLLRHGAVLSVVDCWILCEPGDARCFQLLSSFMRDVLKALHRPVVPPRNGIL